MKRICKILTTLIIITSVICSAVVSADAAIDLSQWNDSRICCFLDPGDASNSDLYYGAVRVKYDRSVNRIYLLFMLDFKEFNDITLCGIVMNFNGMGDIELRFDGTESYDENVYFAQLDEEIHDKNSRDVVAETTVGIKSGIPDKVIMNVYVLDTNGVRSNLYSVDITEESEDETAEETNKADKTNRTAKRKSTKSTKVKTTKSKKSKTSKTTKTKKSEKSEETQTVIDYSMNDKIEANDRKKNVMLVLGAAAAAVAVASGCVAGIKNRKKDNDGGR